MDKNKKFRWSSFVNPTAYRQTQRNLWIAVAVMTVILMILLAYIAYLVLAPELGGFLTDPPLAQDPNQGQAHIRPTDPDGKPLVMLEHLTTWYEENNALAGWLRIEDTKIDYPVIYTPWDPDAYLRMNFSGKFSMDGTLFIDGGCSIAPESDNIIIYGHNMRKGTMFRDLIKYAKKSYWEEHPIIEYSTLYEERTYEVIAAFYDKVYYTHDDHFKFYKFYNYENEAQFQEAVFYYDNMALYDTGVEPQFGDRLLTLVTCSYHVHDGRFVVVAREITEETTPAD